MEWLEKRASKVGLTPPEIAPESGSSAGLEPGMEVYC